MSTELLETCRGVK